MASSAHYIRQSSALYNRWLILTESEVEMLLVDIVALRTFTSWTVMGREDFLLSLGDSLLRSHSKPTANYKTCFKYLTV